MRTLLLAVTLGFFTQACMTDVADRTSSPETAEERSSPAAPSFAHTAGDGSQAFSCAANCRSQHEACLDRAQDEPEACLCDNGFKMCIRGCGQPSGPLEVCP